LLASETLFDLLSLTVHNGHIGWYSENSVPHRGQYQAILATLNGLLGHASLLDLSDLGRHMNCDDPENEASFLSIHTWGPRRGMQRRRASQSIAVALASAESLTNRMAVLPAEVRDGTTELALAILALPARRRGRSPKLGGPRKVGGPPKIAPAAEN